MKTFSKSRVFIFGGEMAQQLTKEDLYLFHTENIRYANFQLEAIRRQTRQLAGEYYWYISKNKECQIKKNLKDELKALTNLYAFILGNRFESQLMKILHENSTVAFNATELRTIKRKETTYNKWRECLKISFRKSTSIDWKDVNGNNLEELLDKNNYLKEFEEFITMRNRLAHGQWSTQLNSQGTKERIPDALNKYDDISKLVLLSKKLDIMVKIVETIVVYREKDKDKDKFEKKISDLIEQNKIIDCRIKKSNLKKYVQLEINRFDKKKSQKRT